MSHHHRNFLRRFRLMFYNTQMCQKTINRRFASMAGASATAAVPSGKIKPVDLIRNIGVSAHIDSGKTTVTERILYYAGKIDEMHEVRGKDEVGATMDYMDLERERGITIQSAATYIDWHGTNINIIDTPGHIDFTVEVERALRVLDGAILVICGSSGVQSQTLTVNRQLQRYNVPFLTFINKLDRSNASHHRALEGLRSKLGHNAALLQLPIGLESDFCGLIDLIEERAMYFEGDDGMDVRMDQIPAEMRAEVNDRRAQLIESVANGDERMGDIYLNEMTPSVDDLYDAIRRATIKRKFMPVLMGSALKNKGIQPVIESVIRYLPNPSQITNYANLLNSDGSEEKIQLNSNRGKSEPFVGLAFKLEAGQFGQMTYIRVYQGCISKGDVIYASRDGRKVRVQRIVRMHANKMEDVNSAYAGDICAAFGVDCASGETFCGADNMNIFLEAIHVAEPVISMTIEPKERKDGENFMKALNRFTKEDPTFRKSYDAELRQTVVHGMGELHLDIYAQRMNNEFKCPVIMGKPKVAFRETLASPCKFYYRHKKQTGGRGQYGVVDGIAEPFPPDKNLQNELINNCIGGAFTKNQVNQLRKGFEIEAEKGPLVGQKVTGIQLRLIEGETHHVDSTEIALINTMRLATQQIYERGKWILLEPIMKVEVTCPLEFRGAVTGSLSERAGLIVSMDQNSDLFVLTAEVSLSNMFGYASDLRKQTEGKGEFTMEYSRYSPVPLDVQTELVREFQISEGIIDPAKEKQKRR